MGGSLKYDASSGESKSRHKFYSNHSYIHLLMHEMNLVLDRVFSLGLK